MATILLPWHHYVTVKTKLSSWQPCYHDRWLPNYRDSNVVTMTTILFKPWIHIVTMTTMLLPWQPCYHGYNIIIVITILLLLKPGAYSKDLLAVALHVIIEDDVKEMHPIKCPLGQRPTMLPYSQPKKDWLSSINQIIKTPTAKNPIIITQLTYHQIWLASL